MGTDTLEELEFGQFENLLNQRIPFKIISVGVDVVAAFKLNPLQKMHINQWGASFSEMATASEVLASLKEAGVSTEFPVVLICSDISSSKNMAGKITEAGFHNVFYLSSTAP